MPVTDTVYTGPAPEREAASVPAAVLPAKDTSLAEKPLTGSLKTIVKRMGEATAGST